MKKAHIDATEAELKLVEWFRQKYAQRTPPREVQDILTDGRVTWTEIRMKAIELHINADVDFRLRWQMLFEVHLRSYINALLRANNELPLRGLDKMVLSNLRANGYSI